MNSFRPLTRSAAFLAVVASLVLPVMSWGENEVGYIEKFALAADREKVLGELVPGSEDYYFFHALHYQNTRQEGKLAAILEQWKKTMPAENLRRRVIENRESLLDYDATPQKTLTYLKERLGVTFNHQQEVRDKKPDLPVALDGKLVAREVFEKDALTNDEGLATFTLEALEALVRNKTPLKLEQRRALLGRLTRPDVPNLVELIATDLKGKDARDFGDLAIDSALLPEQLAALVKLVPKLENEDAFVYAKLRKLAPSEDVDIRADATEREAWLDRVWAEVKKLPQSFTTLKAHTLYLRLDHDRKKGVYDAARFLEYLKLPKSLPYVNQTWFEKVTQRQAAVELNQDLHEALLLQRPIETDEPLVREYFLQLFQRTAATSPATIGESLLTPYTPYVRAAWLKPILAEALILSGQGEPERWASLISPQEFQQLKARVDIEFPATNAPLFQPATAQGAGDDVQFDVVVKNTPKLIVKIYELNTLNFFLTQRRQLNTDLNLDGLVANSEQTHTFDTGPFKRTRQTFKFPELKGRRGAWVIEFIGGGRSSRALVRIGQWQVLQQTGPAGDLLTVLDEHGEPIKDAVAWLDGRRFEVNKEAGRIVIPFTTKPGNRRIVLANPDGTFATLTDFEHHAESYVLDAQFHLEREQLLAGREATLAIRPTLLIGESQLDPAALKEPKLTLTSLTLDGVPTTTEIKDLKLTSQGVFLHTLHVPERLAALQVTLSGKIEILSEGGAKRDLNASHSWTVNGIDKTDATNDGHLSNFSGNYVYELLGKNGEPIPDQPIYFTFKHREFARPQNAQLKTDERGRVNLGPLTGLENVNAKAPNGRAAHWELETFQRTWSSVLHAREGQPVRVPLPPAIAEADKVWVGKRIDRLPEDVSLLQVREGTFTSNHSAKLKVADNFLVLEGLAAGDYSLRLRGVAQEIAIKITAGKLTAGWFLGKARNLEAKNQAPLQITDVVGDADFITVKLAHASPFARVHVAATRFVPASGLFAELGGFARFGVAEDKPAHLPNLYSAGRNIGDEYRYILERRYAKLYPGNMLTRPGLLLNPWTTRDTNTEELAQDIANVAASTGGAREREVIKAMQESARAAADADVQGRAAGETNLDFLASTAPVIYNFLPDADGKVKLDRKIFGDRQHLQIYAEDLSNAVWRTLALPEVATKFADQRLVRNLDPAKPFTQKKEVSVLGQGKTLTIEDLRTSELETYDTLGGAYSLLATLSGNDALAQFAWVLQWPKLKDDEKRAKYSEFACHELNLFLAKKDPEFFDKVVKPYLANKQDKTFMDDFLLGVDLKEYLEPWAYERLNVVERALLGQRSPAEAAAAARHLRERWELLPLDLTRQDQLFDTALRGKALDEVEYLNKNIQEYQRAKIRALKDVADVNYAIDPTKPGAKGDKNGGTAHLAFAAPSEGGLSEGLAVEGRMAGAGGGKAAGKPEDASRKNLAGAVYTEGKDIDGKRLAHSSFSPAYDDGKPAAPLGGSPITAGNRSGQLGINANAMDAVLFGEEDRKKTNSLRGFRYADIPNDHDFTDLSTGVANFDSYGFFGANAAKTDRAAVRSYYRQVGATKEWAENNYYHLRITQQDASLILVNAYWADFAEWTAQGAKGPFVSAHLAEASRNFTEIMLALAVLDLPFDAPKHTSKADGAQFTLTAGGPMLVFHQEIKPATAAEKGQSPELLVSQSFFRQNDRFRQKGNERFEKYVTEEFLTGAVYGANVVVTNPTSSPVKGDVLLQIPQGALPVLGSKATNSVRVELAPYTTKTFEYYFYFPLPAEKGAFAHYPVSVAVAGHAAGAAKPLTFNVVSKLTQVDKASWDYLSQSGTDEEVLAFLAQNNLEQLDLTRVAWRAKQAPFFKKLTTLLRERHVWNETIYSYALLHNEPAALREWLSHKDQFVVQCGPWLSTTLLLSDPIERRVYEHLEYSPLVNQRAHRLGSEVRIANPAVLGQYQSLLNVLAYKPKLDAIDGMSVTYYLFLQDRVEEGLGRFKAVDAAQLPEQIQHDYFKCYAAFYEEDLASARGVATKYAAYPVTRWQKAFGEVTSQLDEIEGKAPAKKIGDDPDREKDQAALAATEPAFDFKVENRSIALTWKNLGEVTINYYLMDPEFSFSSNPFVSQDASRFSIVKPNQSATQALPKDQTKQDLPLPPEFAKANVLVEVVAAGQRKAQAYHANTLKLNVAENYGRIEAHDSATDKPVPQAYVKVYAKLANGTVRFFKDGYTDLRGRFDYASLNAPSGKTLSQIEAPNAAPANGLDYQMLKPAELANVRKLAILVLSETNGATTREVDPPRE
jgi:hypothetical protein